MRFRDHVDPFELMHHEHGINFYSTLNNARIKCATPNGMDTAPL